MFLGVISLFWIFFVGSNLLDDSKEYSPAYFFGKADQRILIVNRLNDIELDEIDFNPTIETQALFDALKEASSPFKVLILSEKQNQLMIERKDKWTKEKVVTYFKKAHLGLNFNSSSEFSMGNFKGVFHNSILYLGQDNVQLSSSNKVNWMQYDKKSSATLISFKKKMFSTIDIYYKGKNSVEYVSENSNNLKGRMVQDIDLFSSVLPSGITNYHFYEKSFKSNFDAVYAKGPLHYWVESGLVEFEYEGDQVIISDFISGKNPLDILYENSDSSEMNQNETSGFFKNSKLSSSFPNNRKEGFYAYEMDNFIVLSPSKSACEKILDSFKKSKTLNSKPTDFFGILPAKVSERCITDSFIYSNSLYGNKLLRTEFSTN